MPRSAVSCWSRACATWRRARHGPDRNPRRNVLDLYLPKAAKDFPVVVFVHGGGWTMGSKDYFVALRNHPGSEFGRFLARNGVTQATRTATAKRFRQ